MMGVGILLSGSSIYDVATIGSGIPKGKGIIQKRICCVIGSCANFFIFLLAQRACPSVPRFH